MSFSNQNVYFFIETLRYSIYNGRQIHELLKNAWLDQFRKVMTEFEDGTRVSFGRKDGSGSLKSDDRIENVGKVNNIINEDSCLTVLDLSLSLIHI